MSNLYSAHSIETNQVKVPLVLVCIYGIEMSHNNIHIIVMHPLLSSTDQ